MTIPISTSVVVTPSVLAPAAGVSALQSMILSSNAGLANVRYKVFTSAASVLTYFGGTSNEYLMAQVFFSGFTNCPNTPSQLTFAYQSDAGLPATLVSGSVAGLTLAQLQAMSGTINLTVDGTAATFTANLSAATSFTNAATILQTAASSVANLTVTYDTANGVFAFNASPDASTSSISYATGTLAAGLNLTPATGAIVYAGFDTGASDPVEILTYLRSLFHFDAFTHAEAIFINLPDEPSASPDPIAIAQWTAAQNNTVMAVIWDNTAAPLTAGNASSFGATVMAQGYSGVVPVYYDPLTAALILGIMSSLEFTETNGRYVWKFRSNSLVAPSVTSATLATTIAGNGYNFYGSFANGQQQWQYLTDGHVAGPFDWIDSFVCQMWMNQAAQLAIVNLLTTVGQIPFNSQGDSLIAAALQPVITQGLSFGAIRQNVTLSASEIAEVQSALGSTVSSILQTQGYYVVPGASAAPAAVRVARGPITSQLYYVDGQAVQQISLSSVDVL